MNEVVNGWGRFIWCLEQNAAAVQALTAIITVVLTVTLIAVTAQYVRLTRGILEAGEASMRSGFLPDLNGGIDVNYPSRDQLCISIANRGASPFRIVRAKIIKGAVYKWTDTPGLETYKAEVPFRVGALPGLANRFLRKDERADTMFTMVPAQPMEESDWLRTSLTVTAVVEVADITGRVFYSFSIVRDAHTASTFIETHFPSVFDSV